MCGELLGPRADLCAVHTHRLPGPCAPGSRALRSSDQQHPCM